MTQLQYIKDENVNAALESGRSLALNFTQVTSLKENFNSKFQQQTPVTPEVQESKQIQPQTAVENNIEASPSNQIESQIDLTSSQSQIEEKEPQTTPVININEPPKDKSNLDTPVIDFGIPFDQGEIQGQNNEIQNNEIQKNEEVPAIDVTPIIDASTEPQVTQEIGVTTPTEEKPQVEIVSSNNKKTEYDALAEKIATINNNYDEQINKINAQRKEEIAKEIEEARQSILDLQDKAAEHLKNAQAAEQIAHIAYENAQNVQI